MGMIDVMQFQYKKCHFHALKHLIFCKKLTEMIKKIGALRLGDEKNTPPQS